MNMYCLLCARHWEPRDEPKGEYGQKHDSWDLSINQSYSVSYCLDKFDQ